MPRQFVRCPPDPTFTAGFRRIRDQLDVPASFSDEVLQAAVDAVAAGPRIPPGSHDAVIDARHIDLMAIDPHGSTDLDQAFSARRHADGFTVFYAIADVAALVMPGSVIDSEARQRGLTLYSPDLRTSLHPESINEDGASLLEGRDRRALLWTIRLDDHGEIIDARLERADVRNRRQLSYRRAQTEVATAPPDSPLALLEEIGRLRQAREAERGAVSLDLPDQEVVRRADGSFELIYDESLPIENWNAQISLLTGIAASRIMLAGGAGLLRTLPEPDPRTVGRLRRTARALGVGWADHVSYAERIGRLSPDTPERAAMLSQAASGLRGAGYVAFRDHEPPTHPRHSAIASTYAHVTAPLRRLCDRFANEILLAQCADRAAPTWAVEALEELPSLMGAAKSRDRNLERALVDYVEAVMLAPRVGESFTAVVTDVDSRRDRGRIQLRDPAVVARLPADGLKLGAEVTVVLEGSDPDERRVEFSLA